jgi:hypothetical protein
MIEDARSAEISSVGSDSDGGKEDKRSTTAVTEAHSLEDKERNAMLNGLNR